MVTGNEAATAAEDSTIFEFEKDFAGSLRCIPMVVRFKLDHCGVKLSLRQWARFTREDRAQLVALPCRTAADIGLIRDRLVALIEQRAHEQAKTIAVEPAPAWTRPDEVPENVIAFARETGVPPPSPRQWARLTPLQRFTLLKLAREGHDNLNFIPALLEFGLLDAQAAAAAQSARRTLRAAALARRRISAVSGRSK